MFGAPYSALFGTWSFPNSILSVKKMMRTIQKKIVLPSGTLGFNSTKELPSTDYPDELEDESSESNDASTQRQPIRRRLYKRDAGKNYWIVEQQ